MPAAAVIPAPIAYIKVAVVKKLVVGSRVSGGRCASRRLLFVRTTLLVMSCMLFTSVLGGRNVYFEKIRVLKAGVTALNNGAWNNGIGPRFYFVGFRSSR